MPSDIAAVGAHLPIAGQLARIVAGTVNLVAIVADVRRGAIVLDVHGARLPAGAARLTFNSSFGGVLLAGRLEVDERGTRFWPDVNGIRVAQRRETFRVSVALPVTVDHGGPAPLTCKTLNLSIGGALLESERPFAPMGDLTLAIYYGDRDPMSLAATAVRTELAAMRLAVAFADVRGTTERKLSLLVAAAQRRALASR